MSKSGGGGIPPLGTTPQSIAKAHATGREGLEAAHYRPAQGQARSCGTCEYFQSGRCRMFKTAVKSGWVCDEWEGMGKAAVRRDLLAKASEMAKLARAGKKAGKAKDEPDPNAKPPPVGSALLAVQSKKKVRKGVAPVRPCQQCGHLMPVTSQECPACGHVHPLHWSQGGSVNTPSTTAHLPRVTKSVRPRAPRKGVVGKTRSGKAVYGPDHPGYDRHGPGFPDFTPEDHKDAYRVHVQRSRTQGHAGRLGFASASMMAATHHRLALQRA